MVQRMRGHYIFDKLEARGVGGILAGANVNGDHFYVDPVNGSSGNSGMDAAHAKATLAQALALCTAYKGDVIHVAKGTQTVTAAVEIDCHGVIIVADELSNPMGNGEMHTIYGSHTDGPAAVLLAPAIIIGMGFCGSQTAGPSLLIDCEEQGGYEGGFNWLYRCRFSQWGIAKAYALQMIGGAVNLIEECTFDGLFAGWATAAISMHNDVGGQAPFDTWIKNNIFVAGGDGKYCIQFASGCVPNGVLISGNKNINGASMTVKFLNTNGVSGKGHILDNWTGGATDTGSYDGSVATLQGNGFQISGNHYSE